MTKPKHFPPVAYLRECFDYDPQTGLFRWRERPAHHFASPAVQNMWLTRFAGTLALKQTQGRGYLYGRVAYDGVYARMLAHRVAWAMWTGEHPKDQIDHINGDRADNRIANLRDVSQTQNNWNRRNQGDWPKGVYWNVEKQKFQAQIAVDGKNRFLGRFDSPDEAHTAWLAAASAERVGFLERVA